MPEQSPSFPLATSGWIPVWDLDAQQEHLVGLTEALTRAHRLRLGTARSEDIALLRLLAAAFDASCGPRDTSEWEAAWRAEAFDGDRIAAYFERWGERLDLFHPQHPAFQCAALTDHHRGPEALHPGNLGGKWFHTELRTGALPSWDAPSAALLLLNLLAYDVAGIKRAAPGDPAAQAGKVYGAQIPPVAGCTHAHLTTPAATLKDMLLLNLPPQPRAAGDAPVWERESPPAPTRTREPAGRLDLLTWPARRIHLRPTADGQVDGVAHHDGDRLHEAWQTVQRLDPMTAWATGRSGDAVPLTFMNAQSWPRPWRATLMLTADGGYSFRPLQHVQDAAGRGLLGPGERLRVVLAATVHSNRHKAAISDIPIATMPLCTAGQLVDPDTREALSRMARYVEAIQKNLIQRTVSVSRRPSTQVTPRMVLSDLDRAWEAALTASVHDLEAARGQWQHAVRSEAEAKIDRFPLGVSQRAELHASYEKKVETKPVPPATSSSSPAPAASAAEPRRRGRPGRKYEAFGGWYTLSQITKLDECQVSYKTLRSRVEAGDPVEEAATRLGRSGPAPSPRPGRDS